MIIVLNFRGTPKPKQSFRFTRSGHRYQPAEVKQHEQSIAFQAIAQLPKGFAPTDKPIVVNELIFTFAPTKSLAKKYLRAIELGDIVFKTTKPDLTDNLSKGLFDALQGIVYRNDSQIVQVENARKQYGFQPGILLAMEILEDAHE